MRYVIVLLVLVSVLVVSGCTEIADNTLQSNVSQVKVCDLFESTVENCGCWPGTSDSYYGNITVNSEKDAIALVNAHIEESESEYTEDLQAFTLNEYFYNVFAYNSDGKEKVFTVATDGTIINTICFV